MELSVQVETTSPIVRKLTVKVPAREVDTRLQRGLAEVQKTAKLKGFRPGQAPISIIKQYYGDDVRHQVFHSLIEESFDEAVRKEQIRTVGSPKIDTPDHKTGDGAHDHGIKEGQDLTFVATVEVMPDVEVKGYTGLAVNQEKVEVTDADVQKVVDGLLDSQAQLVPAEGGLLQADGTQSSRPVKMGDHIDLTFDGGVVKDGKIEKMEGMKGNRVLEVGSNSLIPGFEEELVGMRAAETKTFKIAFPKEYHAAELAGQPAEFTVTVNEVKEKKLPELNDETVKQMGYENVDDLRSKAREFLTRERTEDSDRKVRSELITAIIEKNSFDVPAALIDAQTRALAQDWSQELKNQGVGEKMIQDAVISEVDNLRKRAEGQVRASLILEAIAKNEKIDVKADELDGEIKKLAVSMKVEEDKLREYYAKNPSRMDDLEFRMRQERTVKFLLGKAKIKSVAPASPSKEK